MTGASHCLNMVSIRALASPLMPKQGAIYSYSYIVIDAGGGRPPRAEPRIAATAVVPAYLLRIHKDAPGHHSRCKVQKSLISESELRQKMRQFFPRRSQTAPKREGLLNLRVSGPYLNSTCFCLDVGSIWVPSWHYLGACRRKS